MAKLPASLLLACLLTFGAGCLDDGPASAVADAAPAALPAGEPAAAEQAPTPAKCPNGGQNNSGTWTQVGDEYIVSPYKEQYLVLYYQESNGCKGLQTKKDFPSNPDTEIAAVPYPVGLKA